MKNDKSIENKLRSAVSHAVPDALDDILSACDHEKGKVIYMEKKRTSPLRSFAAIAAVLVLVIAGIFAIKNLGGSSADTLAAVVSLDVNPSIELNVDKDTGCLDLRQRNIIRLRISSRQSGREEIYIQNITQLIFIQVHSCCQSMLKNY